MLEFRLHSSFLRSLSPCIGAVFSFRPFSSLFKFYLGHKPSSLALALALSPFPQLNTTFGFLQLKLLHHTGRDHLQYQIRHVLPQAPSRRDAEAYETVPPLARGHVFEALGAEDEGIRAPDGGVRAQPVHVDDHGGAGGNEVAG
jgi:hypothetical protein